MTNPSAGRRRPGLLFVSQSSPLPTSRGGNQRTNLLLRALREIGSVDFVYVHRDLEPVAPELEERLREEFGLVNILRPWGGPEGSGVHRVVWKARALVRIRAPRIGYPMVLYREDPSISGPVQSRLRSREYDLVVGRYLESVAVSRPFGPAPVIVDADDYEPVRFEARSQAADIRGIDRVLAARSARAVRRKAPGLLSKCAHAWVPGEVDLSQIRDVPATVLPNIPFDPPPDPGPAGDDHSVLLVASFRYEVNRVSVAHFVRAVWPRVRRAVPDAVLRIVGAGLPRSLQAKWAAVEGVEAPGFVDDLDAVYERCLFTVAPLFHGGGTKIKVLESLAYRRACVTTTHVQTGFGSDLPADSVLAVADEPSGLADRCIELLGDPGRARRMADRGRDVVADRYTFDRFRSIVLRTVERVLVE